MVYKIEIIGVIFAVFMIYLTYIEYKKRGINKFELFVWSLLWVAGLLLIIFHNYFNFLLKPLPIFRVFDLYTILAFMFLFTLIFFLYMRNKKTEKRIEEITRAVVLKGLKDKK